jgi:hypothetical protein
MLRPYQQDRLKVRPGSLGAIIRSYKSAVTKAARQLSGQSNSVIWQRNFYEHVIRDQRELDETRFYIAHNVIPH